MSPIFKTNIIYKIESRLTQTQIIAYGFALIILTGSFLLNLPIASRNNISINYTDALFTATSATCVTGLVIKDTYEQWSIFGQLVILSLIQIGGLGFITLVTYFLTYTKKKINLKEREFIKESLSFFNLKGVVGFGRKIINIAFTIEIIGAIFLSFRFIPKYGPLYGSYYSLFHSISAFCNAGFDLMGKDRAFSSFTGYNTDWLVNIDLCVLIIIGGIGFIVWNDYFKFKFNLKKYSLHSKIAITTTLILIIVGTLTYFQLEKNNLYSGLSVHDKFLNSFFSSVTARTAGFNTSDTSKLSEAGKLFTILLMFIGGSPASTAGGIKTTTIAIIFITLYSHVKNRDSINVYGRRLHKHAINKAAVVVSLNLFLAFFGAITIMYMQPFSMEDTLFETFSAIGTVGMSTGITGHLSFGSKIVIIALMYLGRLGSLTFAFLFARSKKVLPIQQPSEDIIVG